jgi:hypothetical protein
MNTIRPREDQNNKIENVLVLRGGVFKAIVSNKTEPDIIAGTSICGINAAL